jgi:hypothetical protein
MAIAYFFSCIVAIIYIVALRDILASCLSVILRDVLYAALVCVLRDISPAFLFSRVSFLNTMICVVVAWFIFAVEAVALAARMFLWLATAHIFRLLVAAGLGT